jgi:hypothetical protein
MMIWPVMYHVHWIALVENSGLLRTELFDAMMARMLSQTPFYPALLLSFVTQSSIHCFRIKAVPWLGTWRSETQANFNRWKKIFQG